MRCKKFHLYLIDRYESQKNMKWLKVGRGGIKILDSWYWKYEKYACWNDAFDREMEGMKVDEPDLWVIKGLMHENEKVKEGYKVIRNGSKFKILNSWDWNQKRAFEREVKEMKIEDES